MSNYRKRLPSALKHGAYSATDVLPGESRSEFDKLHQHLIAEYCPSGAHERDIIKELARLLWRKENLTTLDIAERAKLRRLQILKPQDGMDPIERALANMSPADYRLAGLDWISPEEKKQAAAVQARAAEQQAQDELGDAYELAKVGDTASFNGLEKELNIRDRLNAQIDRCLKRLLMVKGLKSITAVPPASSKRSLEPPRAGIAAQLSAER